MKKPISSYHLKNFYSKAINYTALIIFLILLTLFSVLGISIYQSKIQEARTIVNTENDIAHKNLTNMFDNCMQVCWYFATYDTANPFLKTQLDTKTYETIITKEADAFLSSYSYIKYIQIEAADYTIGRGTKEEAEFTLLQSYNGYEIHYIENNRWPQIIQIKYQPMHNYCVTIDIDTMDCSRKFFNSNSALVTSDGNVIIAKDALHIGKNLSDLYGIWLQDSVSAPNTYSVVTKALGTNASVITIEDMTATHTEILKELLLIVFAFLMAIIILSYITYHSLKRIYAPIDKVVQVLKYYLPENSDLPSTDVDFITNALKRQNMEVSTEAVVRQVRTGQLQVLHSQISPHFLGNSLEVLKWKIIKQIGIKPDIENSFSIISSFLSNSYEYQQMITTISEEMVKTENYFRIVKYCFHEKLEVVWDVDCALYDTAIIALTLQPLIENSVFHGFADIDHTPVIRIRIYNKKGIVNIVIADNGCGMSKEHLESIRQSLKDEDYTKSHIGLKNTHLKYKLLFGEEYGITNIESDSSGTAIT